MRVVISKLIINLELQEGRKMSDFIKIDFIHWLNGFSYLDLFERRNQSSENVKN